MPEPSADALNHLSQTHEEGCRTLKDAGWFPESFDVAAEVEGHRWYWKPKEPKLILVAESHVFTSMQDLDLRVDQGAITPFLNPKANLLPDRFVRLVYCLAYGESELLTTVLPQWKNRGTAGYWDLFGRVTFRGRQPCSEDGAALNDRMQWKIETLREMYRMGIWLLDASVHAIYRGNQIIEDQGKPKRLPEAIQNALHKQWWKGYGRHVVDSCQGVKIWVIGKTVFDCLNGQPSWQPQGWVYQPNAREVDLERNWPQLLEDCRPLKPGPENTPPSRDN